MNNDPEQIGLAAVDRFINTWNSRDPVAWAGSLNFPHVRPAPFGPIAIAADAAEYIARVDFQRVIETGWDHSEWDYKQVLHTSTDKIHVVGQWSRVNANGEIILTNPVVYIVTRVANHWGIQSRFSADYAGEDDTTAFEQRAFRLVETFIAHLNQAATASCAELINYPHIAVGVGELDCCAQPADLRLPAGPVRLESMMALQTGRHSINLAVDLTLSGAGGRRQAILNLNNRDNHLGIQAWSILDPDQTEPN